MSDTRLSFTDFVKKRFDNNGNEIARELHGEISRFLDSFDADWDKISDLADFSIYGEKILKEGGGPGKYRFAKNPKHKGSISIWTGAKKSQSGLVYPYITINHLKLGKETWTGYDGMRDLYDREQGIIDLERQRKRQAAIEKREQEREAQRAIRLEQEKKARAERQAEHDHYRQLFVEADQEPGDHPYLEKKQIGDISQHLDIRRMRDPELKLDDTPYLNGKGQPRNLFKRLGEFVALQAEDIDGNYRGLQRLYKGTKLQTNAVDSGQFKGSFILIGEIDGADEVGTCEGFATGASVFLAKVGQGIKFCMIVAISADNMAEVCRIFKTRRPELKLTVYTDNDCWKQGNTGRRNGLTIAKEYGYKVVIPTVDDIDPELKAKDFNDVHCFHSRGLREVGRQLKARANRLKPADNWFEYTLQKLAVANKQNSKALANEAINAGMGLVPLKFGTQEVIDSVCLASPAHAAVNQDYIKDRVMWVARAKLKSANATRAFSSEALKKPNINYIKVDPETVSHNGKLHNDLPSGLIYTINQLQGPVILRAPMGTGKTDKVIKPLLKQSDKGLYLAHRVSLIGDASKRLEMNNYQDMIAAAMPYTKHLACCVNSITNPKFADFLEGINDICIDEAAQTLQHICEGGSVHNPVKVLGQLLELIRNCRGKVLFCDADANDSLIELCELARPGETIHIIEMVAKRPDRTLSYTDYDSAYQAALEAVGRGEKVYVPTDSADTAKGLAEQIAKAFPDKKCLSVYRESKGNEEVERFLANPNQEAVHYDVITASPAISSGLSITVDHFNQVIGLLSGVVSPSNAMQMLARIRPATDFLVGLRPRQSKRETDRARIWRGLIEADKDNTRLEETPEQVALVRRKLPFDELRIRVIADENKAQSDFANHLLLIAAQEGWQVKRQDNSEEFRQAGAAHRKLAIEEVRENAIMMRLEAPDIDESEAFRLSRTEMISEADSAKLDRFNIKANLCTEDVSREDVEFWQERGLARLRRFELLRATREQADTYDQEQRSHGIAITKRARKLSQWQVLQDLFNMTGLDPHTGEGIIDPAGAQQFLEHISRDDGAIDRFNQLKLGPYIDPLSRRKRDPIKLVMGILENVGLTTEATQITKARLRRRVITRASWECMDAYYQQRQQAGVWSLEPPTYDELSSDAPADTAETPQPAPQAASDGGAGLQEKVYHLTRNPLHVDYPAVIPIVHQAVTGLSLTPEEVLSWLSPPDWGRIQSGELSLEQLRCYLQLQSKNRAAG